MESLEGVVQRPAFRRKEGMSLKMMEIEKPSFGNNNSDENKKKMEEGEKKREIIMVKVNVF